MKKKFTPSLVLDKGRHRLAIWFRWNLFKFKWGIKSDGPGTLIAGFGFGMFTYMRRNYSK